MSAGQIRFRKKITVEDIPRIKEILVSTDKFFDYEIPVALELMMERLLKGPESGYFFLLAEKPAHTVAGYACFGPIACTTGSFDLYWIAVHAQSQGTGIGRLLLQKSELEMKTMGASRIFIETSSRPAYAATQNFYSHNGYTLAARVEKFYSDTDDKLIFVKPV